MHSPKYPSKYKFSLILICFILSLVFTAESLLAQNKKPNIIFILADDIGYSTLTVNGGLSFNTPNLDNLANNGMNFSACHAMPSCSPSRVTLLTGKYNFRNYTQWAVLDTSQRTIANMFQDAGYKTGCFGKWQLDGGDASIRKSGFDDYCVFNPFSKKPPRYKNPQVYANGAFLPDSLTKGKYGEDIFFDSLSAFIEKNSAGPFFAYYPMVLAHAPFQPTPDDSAYAKWKSTTESDTSFYPSMISYMDKKIGELRQKISDLGIADNTVIIYCGDNGTPRDITEETDEGDFSGDKGGTTELATHVPLIIYWPNVTKGGQVNNDLIDFTDFMPTLASIAGIPLPTNYGTLDGVNFSPRLKGEPGTPRSSLFFYYNPRPGTTTPRIWAQTATYKLYDSSAADSGFLFYNFTKDINEENPIPDPSLTPEEDSIRQFLLSVLNRYIEQGIPLFSNVTYFSLTDSSVVLRDSILINGCSAVTESGFVLSTSSLPTITSGLRFTTPVQIGAFRDTVTKLLPDQTYYVRAYAINKSGVNYSSQISFKTLLNAPLAEPATITNNNSFIANWEAIPGINTYQIDISTTPFFSIPGTNQISETFDNGKKDTGWNFDGNFIQDKNNFGESAPSFVFNGPKATITTPAIYNAKITQLKFWMKALSNSNDGPLLVEAYNGDAWVPIKIFYDVNGTGTTKTINAFTNPSLPGNISQFRFTNENPDGDLAIDDITINYSVSTPSFEPGFNNLPVDGDSLAVTGLNPGGTYYYRVRAITPENISVYSNVVKVSICKNQIITGINIEQEPCMDSQNGSISIQINGNPDRYNFKWQGPDNFTSTNKNISDLQAGLYYLSVESNNSCTIDTIINLVGINCDTLPQNVFELKIFPNPSNADFTLKILSADDSQVWVNVYNLNGKRLYSSKGSKNDLYQFGNNFLPGIYFVNVIQGKKIKTAKIIKSGN